ncbi:MAG: TonB-dependent receptor [Tannerella sp.]|jgi:outer membrane cobalamin receptor|nr:TonB-dependent receptor [Tannerella sp.]
MIIRRSLFLLLCFLFFYAGIAQEVELKGRVVERLSGEPLASALIKVKGTSIVAVSGAGGNYSIRFKKKGTYTVSASYIGFSEESKTVDLRENRTVDFLLDHNLQLDEIVVTSTAPNEHVKTLTMGVEKLSAAEIKQMPALMGEVDVIKAIQLLPGVQTASEGGSGFSVRGGSPDHNLILIDNTTVYNASHLMGFFSIFNNDVLSGLDLYKGDLPLKYGGRLSSLLDVRTKSDHPERFGGVGGIGLISSRLMLEGPAGEKTSWLAGGRRSYADLFLKLSSNEALRKSSVYFYDLNAKVTHRFSNKDIADISGYYGKDSFGAEPGDFHYGNGAFSTSWRHIYSPALSSGISFNISNYDYGLKSKLEGSRATWKSSITDYMLRADMMHSASDRWLLTYGLSSILHRFKPGYAQMDLSIEADAAVKYEVEGSSAFEHGIYFSAEQQVSDKLSVKYGARLSVFQNIGKATVYHYNTGYEATDSTVYKSGEIYNTHPALEPRLGFVWQLCENSSLKGNYVHNVQFMQLANNSASGSPLDVWFPAGPNIKPQAVDMFSAGYFRNLADNMYETSVEVYYKNQKNVIDFAEHANLMLNKNLEGEVRTGKGMAYGAEFMVRKQKGRLTGFVNYTLSRSERTVPEVNQGKTYLSPYDRTHSLNVVANYELSKKISFSAIWVYATGNPTTYPSGRFEIDGEYFPIYSARNEYRRPDYHRLDLSFTYIPKPDSRKRLRGEWNISLYNAYGKKNPWMITYNQHEETGLPRAEMTYLFGIVPSITYNFKF